MQIHATLVEGNLAVSNKITYVFTIWLSNPTSRNLPWRSIPKYPQVHTHEIFWCSIALFIMANIGNKPNAHPEESSWMNYPMVPTGVLCSWEREWGELCDRKWFSGHIKLKKATHKKYVTFCITKEKWENIHLPPRLRKKQKQEWKNKDW